MRIARGAGRDPVHLPVEYRGEPVTEAIVRELEWTRAHLPHGAEGVGP
jgi:hypothetical protein